MGNMQGSDKQSKTNKSPAKSKNFMRNLNRKTPLRESYKNIRKKSESRDVKKAAKKKAVVNSKESMSEQSDDDVEIEKCVQREAFQGSLHSPEELEVRGTQVTDLTCQAELSARSSNRDQTPDGCGDVHQSVACASPRLSQSLRADNKDSVHIKNEHSTDKSSAKNDSTPTKESSSDSVFTDPLTPLGFAAEINQCYYSAESDSTAEDQNIQVHNNNRDVLDNCDTQRPCSRLSISRVIQINVYNSLCDYSEGSFVNNSDCNMSNTEFENNNAINPTPHNICAPYNICGTKNEINVNNIRVEGSFNNQFDSGDVFFSDKAEKVMGSILSQSKSSDSPDSENISDECNNDLVENRLKPSGAQMSFTLSRHRKVELPPSKLTDVCLISNATESPELKRHASASEASLAGDSNVLRKVASLTFDKCGLDSKTSKSKIVPEKLDCQIYEKFEGQMLVNWFVSAISDEHHLRSMLSLQDLRSLSGQYCSQLLAAGVLRRIADKDAPTDTNFRPDLMYHWAHTEALPNPPSTPGRIQMSSWSPLCDTENKMRTENKIVEEKRRNKSIAEETIYKSPFRKQDDSLTINIDTITKSCSCSLSALPDTELTQKIEELELQADNLRKELEKYKMLLGIQNLKQSVLTDFGSPVKEKLSTLSKECEDNKIDVGTQTLDVGSEQYSQTSNSMNNTYDDKKSVIKIPELNDDEKIEKNKSIEISYTTIRNRQINGEYINNIIPNTLTEKSDFDNVQERCNLNVHMRNFNSVKSNIYELENEDTLHSHEIKNTLDSQLDSNKASSQIPQKADRSSPKRLQNGLSVSVSRGPFVSPVTKSSCITSPTAKYKEILDKDDQSQKKNVSAIPASPLPAPVTTLEITHCIGPSSISTQAQTPRTLSGIVPPPPPMPGMGPTPPLMTGMGPPPPPMPGTGPPPPPMPGMSPTLPHMPGIGPPPPPMPGMGPPPPPMPGMGPTQPLMTGIGPPPPPMPSMGPPPPSMPGIGPPPPPMPGMGPPPPPMPGMGPTPPHMPEMGPTPPPMPGMGPPPPPMPGAGPPPPPFPGMAPPPPHMHGMPPSFPATSEGCPPPPPMNGMFSSSPCGVPPPPPSPAAAGPMPFPTPPAGGWNGQKACLRKTAVVPVVPMKPLYWTRILAPPTAPPHAPAPPDNFKPLWLEIEETRLDNIDEFSELFSRQVVSQKVVEKKVHVSTKVQPKKVLDSKRSQNVGILAQSLHVEFSEIENAIYNFDTSVVSLEALQQIYELRATEEEISLMKEHLTVDPGIPLDKPEAFLHELASIPHFAQRIACFMFEADFQDAISTIMHKLDNLKHTCEFLMTSEHLKKLFAIILTLGNYMNGGNGQRGQADGFGLEILAKLRDVKSKESTVTLLHFIVRTYMRASGGALDAACVLPVPLPEDVERAANVNFDDVHTHLATLHRQLQGCREKAKEVLSFEESSETSPDDNYNKRKAVFADKMNKFLHIAEDKLKSETESLQDCRLKFTATMRFYQFIPKKGKLEDCQPKDFFVFWSPFCADFKDIFKKEEQIAIKERLKENKRRHEERMNKNKVIPKKEGGLKARLQRLAAKR